MKRIIQISAAVIFVFALILYQCSASKAVLVYQEFAGQLYRMKFADAKKRITDTAAQDFAHSERFYRQAYGTLRDAPTYPRYKILIKDRLSFPILLLKLDQTVPADLPGVTSAFGTTYRTYIHEVKMVLDWQGWKIARFSIYSTIGGKPLAALDFSQAVQDIPKKPAGDNSAAVVSAAALPVRSAVNASSHSDPTSQTPEDLKVFHLKNGSVVKGGLVHEDPVYYTLQDITGKQIIVLKEDILE